LTWFNAPKSSLKPASIQPLKTGVLLAMFVLKIGWLLELLILIVSSVVCLKFTP